MINSFKYIGFDLGAESGRCVVAELENHQLKLNVVHRFTTHNYQSSKGFFWDIEKIYEEIIIGLIKAREMFGPSFESIGVDTWGVDYVLLNDDNIVLNDPYHYRDNRTDDVMDEVFNIIPRKQIYTASGTQFQQFNTLFQLFSEKKERLLKAESMLLIPDYINFLLTGEIRSEFTIASTTGLTDPYKRDWNWNLIDKLDLPKNIFSEMVEPGSMHGQIRNSIAEQTGLNSDIPIIATAGHDTASAVVSVPARIKNWAFLSSGTWSLIGKEIQTPCISSVGLDNNFTNEGGVEKTTRLLKNIIGLWPIQECKRHWEREGKNYSYQELQEKTEKHGRSGKKLDLNDPRFLKAGEMPDKIMSYLEETHQELAKSDDEIIRIIIENLARNYKNAIDELEELSGEKVEVLHAVGGGIQNELLNQITADILKIKVIAGPIEGTIIGNVGVQAIATGVVNCLADWREIVANSFETKTYKPKCN